MNPENRDGPQLEFMPLPEAEGSEYLKALVHNCIVAYSRVLSDKTALDYNKVPDSLRAVILEDGEYRRETRSIRAKKMMDEVREIEYLADAAMKPDFDDDGGDDDDDDDIYDPRAPRSLKKQKPSADKDAITMRFKAAQLRRDLLNLSAGVESSEEAAALNVFYIPLSREEFMKLAVTDVHAGEDTGKSAFAPDTENPLPGFEMPERKGSPDEPLYVTHGNGDVEEL
jgi:hypothetical protein